MERKPHRIALALLSLALVACNEKDKPAQTPPKTGESASTSAPNGKPPVIKSINVKSISETEAEVSAEVTDEDSKEMKILMVYFEQGKEPKEADIDWSKATEIPAGKSIKITLEKEKIYLIAVKAEDEKKNKAILSQAFKYQDQKAASNYENLQKFVDDLCKLNEKAFEDDPELKPLCTFQFSDKTPFFTLKDKEDDIYVSNETFRLPYFFKGESEIPESLGSLENLKELDLTDSSLKIFPEFILSLKNLQILNLDENNFGSLPDNLSVLNKLAELSLYNCELGQFPEVVLTLKNLKLLDLQENHLEEIPDTIDELENLTQLYVSGNKLKGFPKEVLALKKLEVLGISDLGLAKLPNELSSLENLRSLFASGNSMVTVPEVILGLKKLDILFLEDNLLVTIPEALITGPKWKRFSLKNNPLSEATKKMLKEKLGDKVEF